MIDLSDVDMSIPGLHGHYQRGDFSPGALLELLLRECRQDEGAVWISLLEPEQLAGFLRGLEGRSHRDLPLFGIPFAVKDNIDVAGLPTTAACPDFTYLPDVSASVVQSLVDAGAVPLGKTNMDQFATGLVGVRSPEPWGPCCNALNPQFISGGSSSGSAVAVSRQWVSFALGTDTAGSGRVPASFNNIVGLKPTRGLLSTRGVVPACRSLDVVSVFALTAADANSVLDCAAVFDASDPYSRHNTFDNGRHYFAEPIAPLRIGVPSDEYLQFYGDEEAAACFSVAVERIQGEGHQIVPVDMEPFIEAAGLLYSGPWVAERYLAAQELLEQSPQSLLPVIREIIGAGSGYAATDTFTAMYHLQALCQRARPLVDSVDFMLTPTAGTCYRTEQVLADPVRLNTNLGYYTNFMNLMDFSALAVPVGFLPSGVGFGITLFHQAFSDKRLLGAGAALQRLFDLPLGASGRRLTVTPQNAGIPASTSVELVVCGAHLSGQPLNWQLTERGAYLLERTRSSANYQLYALADGRRPGMVRDEDAGVAVEVEVWSMPKENFGSFVAEIPAPLGIGRVELESGRWCSGFICEPYGLKGGENISSSGGWIAHLSQR